MSQNQFKIGPEGFALIERWEGFRSEAYQDIVGVWTIGFGTTRLLNGQRVKKGDTISLEDARRLMQSQAQKFLDEASSHILVTLSQKKVDAIASFIYNLGVAAFLSSTFLKRINAKDWEAAANQLVRQEKDANGDLVWKGWINAGGKPAKGLINRRLDEKRLFLEG